MHSYQFKAVNYEGTIKEGCLQAENDSAVVLQLQESGYIPIVVKAAVNSTSPDSVKPAKSSTLGRGKREQVIAFTRNLATLLNAGLPLERALKIQLELQTDGKLTPIVGVIYERLREGESFAAIIADHPRTFSSLYVSLVRAGEALGNLDIIMTNLAEYLESTKQMRDSLVSALIYPVLLVFVTMLSIVGLLVYVIPRFAQMFADMGGALPATTQMVIAASDLLNQQGGLLASAMVMSALALKFAYRNETFRSRMDSVLIRMPAIGSLIGKIEVARFAHTLSLMLANGVVLLTGIEYAKKVVANRPLRNAIDSAQLQLEQGGSLAGALKTNACFPQLAVHLFMVGEESGQLEQMTGRVAKIYENEVKTALQRLIGLIEPVLIIGLGIIVAVIILSVLSAVLSVNELVV